jgi:uncharacterized protein (TIGR03437 family)
LSAANSVAIDATGKTRIQKQVQFPAAAPLTVSLVADLIANPQGYYVNIHTTDHAGGAMRGQLMPADMKVLMGLMSAKNEVPPTGVNASGVASVLLLRAHDATGAVAAATAIFNLDYTGFDAAAGTSFTGFHIHSQTAGNNGSVVINTGIGAGANSVPVDPSGAGNLSFVVAMSPLDTSWATAGINGELNTVNSLFATPANQYINAHTDKFGGGVMRDQMRNTERNIFQVTMLPANEVPPIAGLTATGPTRIPVYVLRNPDGSVAAGAVLFDVNPRGFPAPTTFTGLHIHEGAAGASAAVVFPSGVDGTANKVVSDTGNGNIFRLVNVSSAAAIASLNRFMQNPNGFYVNLHTTVNPGGAIREQLMPALAKPAISYVSSGVTTAAPGAIMSVVGTSLSPLASGVDMAQFTALPSTMDGVTVTVGGVKAAIYTVFPVALNIQIPFEVALGPQPLVVTTAGGVSTAFTLTVANAAPSIFVFDQIGTSSVVKNSDFSLLTATNKAKVGDIIVIYSTGLGQTTPAMTTGAFVVPPASGFNNTSTVTVTIGGVDAPVIYSLASPGFAGLYQTAVTIPSGVTGSVPLVLTSGTAKSNSVNIPVQ